MLGPMGSYVVISNGDVESPSCGISLDNLVVRPIVPNEENNWNKLMAAHHYLGFQTLMGHSLKYVAILDGQWVGLIGWGAAALKTTSRDQWIGWSPEQKMKRLKYVVNNQRFLILPGIQIKNLASKILALNTKRLSADWQAAFGYPVLMAETFVDHQLFEGTCYKAAGWMILGKTRGYGRKAGKYCYHGEVKKVLVKPLVRKVRKHLTAMILPPAIENGNEPPVDLNKVLPGREKELLDYLDHIPDPRHARGIRHSFTSVLAMAACGILSGKHDYIEIAEWVASLTPDILKRLGSRRDPNTGTYTPPSEPTIRRTLQAVDGNQVDYWMHRWIISNVDSDATGIAIDGKALKGSKHYRDGKPVHLVAAFLQKQAITIAQTEVEAKTNEINAIRPLLEHLDIEGKVITADALHCQVKHAHYIVDEKKAHYIFQVKQNQPMLFDAIRNIPLELYSQPFVTTETGHGRHEERSVRTTAEIVGKTDFPHVAQVVRVERTVKKVKTGEVSHDISFYITSLPPQEADDSKLGGLIRGHWGIENKLHWIRDVICGEDDSKIGKGSGPRVLASLINLAISLFRLAKKKCMSKEFRRCGLYTEVALSYIGL